MRNNYENVAIQSAHIPLIDIGNIKAKSAAALSATSRKYSSAIALAALSSPQAVVYNIPAGINFLNAAFKMNANNSEAGCDIYLGWCNTREDSELIRICSVAITAGQQTSVDSKYLADTLVITNNNWFDIVKTCVPAADHMAMLSFDRYGADILVVHCHTTLTATEELGVMLTGV